MENKPEKCMVVSLTIDEEQIRQVLQAGLRQLSLIGLTATVTGVVQDIEDDRFSISVAIGAEEPKPEGDLT